MISKSKDQTESTPPSSSAGVTAAKEQLSEPLASSESTLISTPITSLLLPDIKIEGKNGSDKTLTTLKITEKSRQHATLAKVALTQLERAGLIRRFKVLSADGTTLQKVRIEFDMTAWTDDLELK